MPSALIVAGSLAAALVAIITFWKYMLPFFRSIRDAWREFVTALYIFNGRRPYVDAVTGEKFEEVPPLGTALAEIRSSLKEQGQIQKEQGEQISDLTSVLSQVADQQVQLTQLNSLYLNVQGRLTKIEPLVAALLTGSAERAATADAAAQALRMVNDHGAITVDPDKD